MDVVRNTDDDTKIVLPVIGRVRNSRIDPVNFTEGQSKLWTKPRRCPTSAKKRQSLAVDGEIETHILLRSAHHALAVKHVPAVIAAAVPRSKQVIENSDALTAVVHVTRVAQGQIRDGRPLVVQVVGKRSAAAVHHKAAALARRRIGMEVVVVCAELYLGYIPLESAHRYRLSVERPGQSDNQSQKQDMTE